MANLVPTEARRRAVTFFASRSSIPFAPSRTAGVRPSIVNQALSRASITTTSRDLAASAIATKPEPASSTKNLESPRPQPSSPSSRPPPTPQRQAQRTDTRSRPDIFGDRLDSFAPRVPRSSTSSGGGIGGAGSNTRTPPPSSADLFMSAVPKALAKGGMKVNLDRMQTAPGAINHRNIIDETRTAVAPDTAAPPFRLNASTGRSVLVDPKRNLDLGRAFRLMEIKCGQNQVRGDFNRQRFHERGGVKRKRLRQQRWRRRFKVGFQAVVRRVEELRRKGW